MIAPSVGQAILLFTDWRSIFGVFLLLTVIIMIWFGIRMPETLPPEKRVPFSPSRIWQATREIFRSRPAVGFTVTAGLVSGAFIGYLNSSQQIFQEAYALGDLFPLYFAMLSAAVGLASFLNARLVMRFGMRFLVNRSLQFIVVTSLLFLGVALLAAGAATPLAVDTVHDGFLFLYRNPVRQP